MKPYIILLCILAGVLAISILLQTRKIETFESEEDGSFYFGKVPLEDHTTRIGKLIYYNDPIFLKYYDFYVLSKSGEKSLGNMKEAVQYIAYIESVKPKRGLSPVLYEDEVLLKVFPENGFNEVYSGPYKIIPKKTPVNNQAPYVLMDDYVSFQKKNGDYLTIKPYENTIELLNSKTVPDNGIFKIINSPQCFMNDDVYGTDKRKNEITTNQLVLAELVKLIETEKAKVGSNEKTIRDLEKKEVLLREEIMRLENSKKGEEIEMAKLNEDYTTKVEKLRNSISERKRQLEKEQGDKKQMAENAIDDTYMKQMKEIIAKGCNQ